VIIVSKPPSTQPIPPGFFASANRRDLDGKRALKRHPESQLRSPAWARRIDQPAAFEQIEVEHMACGWQLSHQKH